MKNRHWICLLPTDQIVILASGLPAMHWGSSLLCEYNQEEVLKIVAEDAARRSEKKFSELIKKLSPGSREYEEVLNASHEKLEELYKKYGISED